MSERSSHAERHARAAETFEIFVPGVETERVSASFSRRLGALGTFAFDAVGEMWARPELRRRDRSLIVVSVLAAQGRDEELEGHTEIGLRNGLTKSEIDEIVLTVAAYAGYPAAMAASRHVDNVFKRVDGVEKLPPRAAAAPKSDEERERDAADVFRAVSGRAEGGPDEHLAFLTGILGGVGELAYRWAFGEVWSRTELSRRDRSLSVIAILTSLGAAPELAVHVPAGIRHGLTREEIEAAITHLSLYCGFPRAVEAMRAAREAFGKMG